MSDAAKTALGPPASERLTIDVLQLHYIDWDNPAEPPLVCVHGYTSSAGCSLELRIPHPRVSARG
jgi:hypothetical protein